MGRLPVIKTTATTRIKTTTASLLSMSAGWQQPHNFSMHRTAHCSAPPNGKSECARASKATHRRRTLVFVRRPQKPLSHKRELLAFACLLIVVAVAKTNPAVSSLFPLLFLSSTNTIDEGNSYYTYKQKQQQQQHLHRQRQQNLPQYYTW